MGGWEGKAAALAAETEGRVAGLFIFASSQTEINVATQKVEVGKTCVCMCLLSTGGSLDVSVTKEKHTLGNRRKTKQKKIFFLHSYMTSNHFCHEAIQSSTRNFILRQTYWKKKEKKYKPGSAGNPTKMQP